MQWYETMVVMEKGCFLSKTLNAVVLQLFWNKRNRNLGRRERLMGILEEVMSTASYLGVSFVSFHTSKLKRRVFGNHIFLMVLLHYLGE